MTFVSWMDFPQNGTYNDGNQIINIDNTGTISPQKDNNGNYKPYKIQPRTGLETDLKNNPATQRPNYEFISPYNNDMDNTKKYNNSLTLDAFNTTRLILRLPYMQEGTLIQVDLTGVSSCIYHADIKTAYPETNIGTDLSIYKIDPQYNPQDGTVPGSSNLKTIFYNPYTTVITDLWFYAWNNLVNPNGGQALPTDRMILEFELYSLFYQSDFVPQPTLNINY